MNRTTMLYGLLLLLGISLPVLADPGEPLSAWEALMEQGLAPRSVTALEREILELLTPEQAKAFARGAAVSEIQLLDGRHSANDASTPRAVDLAIKSVGLGEV